MDPNVIGAWISIFLTICIFSYLYGDNPVYKLAEHLFVGISIGVAVTEQWFSVLKPNLVDPLMRIPEDPTSLANWSYLIPLGLLILLFMKLTRRFDYLARIPVAFLVSAFAALKVTGEIEGNLTQQLGASMPNLTQVYAEHGLWDWAANGQGVFSSLLLVIGLASCLFYFYFSAPQTGVLRYISRFAIGVLMVAFGASFGMTVMGRITLAFGRAVELLGLSLDPELAAKVNAPVATMVSIVVVAGVIILHRVFSPPPPEEEDDDGAWVGA